MKDECSALNHADDEMFDYYSSMDLVSKDNMTTSGEYEPSE